MDWAVSCLITLGLFLAFPFIGKFVVEPYCQYCDKVMFKNVKGD